MVIHEMEEQECFDYLERASFGRIGCSHEDQPYVVQVWLACEAKFAYVLSTVGQKVEWMRQNPKVCIAVDEIASESRWTSVIANGLYQELHEPQFSDERERAKKLLEKRHQWWQTAFAERQAKSEKQLVDPIFFRVEITSVSGLRTEAK
jgi:nitroimidazol reductase NimA-like FMN-containing flavoprotein (pyridoxamine 5'-phosphate oxidase superfamily)